MLKEDEQKRIYDFYRTMLFSVKTKVSDWVETNFFFLAVFGENLLAGDIHTSVTIDRDVQP